MAAVVRATSPATFAKVKLAVATLIAPLFWKLFTFKVDAGKAFSENVLPIAAVVRLTLPPTFWIRALVVALGSMLQTWVLFKLMEAAVVALTVPLLQIAAEVPVTSPLTLFTVVFNWLLTSPQ